MHAHTHIFTAGRKKPKTYYFSRPQKIKILNIASNIWNILILKYTNDSIATEFSSAANFANTVVRTQGWDMLRDLHQGGWTLLTAVFIHISPKLSLTHTLLSWYFPAPAQSCYFFLGGTVLELQLREGWRGRRRDRGSWRLFPTSSSLPSSSAKCTMY